MKKILILHILLISFLYAELSVEEKVLQFTGFIKAGNPLDRSFCMVEFVANEPLPMLEIVKKLDTDKKYKKKLTQKLDVSCYKDKPFRIDYSGNLKNMCQQIFTVDGVNCPKEIFMMAMLQGCDTISTTTSKELLVGKRALMFEKADPYYNENECFAFNATLTQRLDKDTALFSSDNGVFLLELLKDKYSEGSSYIGVARGTGMYKYTTVLGSKKTIPKGKMLSFKKN
ncbi:hypothetical protein [Candidatus Sulfurimonas baltica]|uniref:Uncharacterized protein n=1 Tax=Candidatus Sulfurimonas baltica TaxID=2740404 RepID=A0A7S7LWC2_9BACT|nr:hypothetical protein [Candidatus Sulfurimonas baltica]QOY52610.1 hypothetical protein HUE88_02675 [Candidatus Sulfurimonas baltica]